MLTATLYVDFGDRFPGGSLSGITVGEFQATTIGPELTRPGVISATDDLTIDSLAKSYGANTANAATTRANIMTLVRRYFEPFDVTVVDLTADFQSVNGHNVRAAATLQDVANTLAANNGDPKPNDSYVFVSRFLVNGTNIRSGFGLDLHFGDEHTAATTDADAEAVETLGIANKTDIYEYNKNDGTAVVFLRDTPKTEDWMELSHTLAHEAGHLFGLLHVYRSGSIAPPTIDIPGTTDDVRGVYQSEIMSYSCIRHQFAMFMRYPTIAGDAFVSDDDYNTVSAVPPSRSTAEQLLADPNVGPGAVEYVTGTGQYDIITITRSSATQATVKVEAFTDSRYTPDVAIPVPQVGGTAYTYSIDLSKRLIIDTGYNDDRIVLDGDLGNEITVRGMSGWDSLVVNGKNAAHVVYQPGSTGSVGLNGDNDLLRGSITAGATKIAFEEFSSFGNVKIQDAGRVMLVTPNSEDVLVLNNDFSGNAVLSGSSGGQRFVPMTWSNVGEVVIDMGTNDAASPGDQIVISAGVPAPLNDLRVLGGAGDDAFAVRRWEGSAVVTLDGGEGNDLSQIGEGDLNTVLGRVVVEGGGGAADKIILSDELNAFKVDYRITPTSVSSTNASEAPAAQPARTFGGLTYSGSTELLDVLGTDGANVFDVKPSVDTRYFIDGNLPAPGSVPAGEGDYLKLDTKTTFPIHPDGLDTSGRRLTMTARGSGRWDFTASTGHEPVDFESIEKFNHVDRIAVAPEAGRTSNPVVRVHDAETMGFLFEIPAAATYGDGYRDGIRVATGDLDNDGIPDVVTAPGRMAAPVIKVFNGAPIPGTEGTEIAGLRLPAAATYGEAYRGGVNVAIGDVVGDRMNDIVLSPDRGKAIVKVFRTRFVAGDPSPSNVKTAWRSFDAFADFPQFIGGANVATADLTGNGRSRIIVGSGSGMDGMVRVFDVRPASPAYTASQTISGIFERGLGGVRVAVGDIDGDGRDDLVMGSGPAGGTWLRARKGGALAADLFQVQIAAGRGSTVPTRFALRDVNGDGRAEVIAAFGADARTGYRLARLRNRQAVEIDSLNVVSAAFSGGGVNLG